VETSDLSDLAWSPDGGAIAVWDHALEYKLLVYAADGRKLAQHVAYEHALGIKGGSVAWSPSGQLLAVGSYDQVRIQHTNLASAPIAQCGVDHESRMVRTLTSSRPTPPWTRHPIPPHQRPPSGRACVEKTVRFMPQSCRSRSAEQESPELAREPASKIDVATLSWHA